MKLALAFWNLYAGNVCCRDFTGQDRKQNIENKVIVALKSAKKMIKAHEIQLVNYLVATGMPVGLLINFGVAKVEVKRKIRQLAN